MLNVVMLSIVMPSVVAPFELMAPRHFQPVTVEEPTAYHNEVGFEPVTDDDIKLGFSSSLTNKLDRFSHFFSSLSDICPILTNLFLNTNVGNKLECLFLPSFSNLVCMSARPGAYPWACILKLITFPCVPVNR
jgi:hypothetical protein